MPGKRFLYFCPKCAASLVAHKRPCVLQQKPFAAARKFEKFRLRGAVLQVDERVPHRIGDELFAKGRVFGGHPVIDHDRAGIDFFHLANDRRPVLHRELDVSDRERPRTCPAS